MVEHVCFKFSFKLVRTVTETGEMLELAFMSKWAETEQTISLLQVQKSSNIS
jgi:hypothetical protein